MSGMNGMNFHSSGMILNVSEWSERQFHDVINCIYLIERFLFFFFFFNKIFF